MPEFIPLEFDAYDWRRDDLRPDLLTAPPYDVLSREERDALAAKSPVNVVNIDLPSSYDEAARLLSEWRRDGVIGKADGPAFFVIASEFELNGETFTRWGVMGGIRLAPWGEAGVFPHEKTYPKHKQDRLELMRATKGQLSPILGVYQDPELTLDKIGEALSKTEPIVSFAMDDGVTHRLWRASAEDEKRLRKVIGERNVYIADGHHRYETALAYRNERGAGPADKPAKWDYVFACLSDITSTGVRILPYHRMLTWHSRFDWDEALRRIRQFYSVKPMESLSQLWNSPSPAACALVENSTRLLLEPKPSAERTEAGAVPATAEEGLFNRIGAHVLDRDFLRGVLGLSEEDLASGKFLNYTPFHEHAIESVEDGVSQAALLLKAVDMDLLRLVSELGLTMPRKSTYFHPKLPAGLLFYLFE